MLVVFNISTLLLCLLLIAVTIYESRYGLDVHDAALTFRRRAFAAFFLSFLAATISRYFTVTPQGVELIPTMTVCFDVIAFVIFMMLASAYFGQTYYKNPYNWIIFLAVPVVMLIGSVIMHCTGYYQPFFHYETFMHLSGNAKFLWGVRIIVIGVLILTYIIFVTVLSYAYLENKKRQSKRITTLESVQNFHEHGNIVIYVIILLLTMTSNFIGSMLYDIICNISMMLLLVWSALVFTRFVKYTRMKQTGEFLPAAIEKELHDAFSEPYNEVLFSSNSSLEELAEMLHVSRQDLSDYIYRTKGMSFSQWVSIKKLELCAKLLSTTDRSIAEVSEEAGYRNVPSMYRAFRQAYGMTPTEYRIQKRPVKK